MRTYYLRPGRGPGQHRRRGGPLVAELRAPSDLPATPLGAALRAILGDLRGTPPAAVVLFTDGVNTEGPSLADAAADMPAAACRCLPWGWATTGRCGS